uniref:GAG-pre-integrase domain-containing protein n=1 Tax=Chenopodium quinoa TaxID=63459 RepID=A0A803MPT1_CHEQI
MSSGYKILFDDGVCAMIDKKSGHSIANVHMTQNQMFPLNVSNDVMSNVLIAKLTNESELWNLRYGHLNGRSLKLLSQKEMVVGLPKISELSFCEGYVYGMHNRASFPTWKAWRASECLEIVHADLCGLMKTESLGGSRYYLLLTDDYSRMSWVYFLKFKSEAFVENQSGRLIIALRTERGAYHLYNLVSGKVIISRNVVFNEEARFKWNVDKDGIADYVPVDGEADEQPDANSTTSSPASTPPSTPSSSTSESPSSSGSSDSRDTPVRRSRSLAELYSSCNYAMLVTDPILFEEAQEQPEWQLTIKEEMVADIFTKALPQAKHDFFWMQLGVCNFESRGSTE